MYQQLSNLGKKIKAAWGKIFVGEASTELQKTMAETVTSDKDKETYTLTYLFSKIREWIDMAQFDTGKEFEYEIKNKKWQEGFQVSKDYLDDVAQNKPLSGDMRLQISAINDDFVDHKDELINDILVANGNAFDGTAFFANSRPNIPDSTIDNLYTGTGTLLSQVEADLKGARDLLKSMRVKDRPVNKNARIVVICPTHLSETFNVLKQAETIDTGGGAKTNTLKGTFDIVENYDQASTNNDWYCANSKSKLKPTILQNRKNVEFKEIDDDDRDYLKYNWKSRYNAGYGNPMACVKVDN